MAVQETQRLKFGSGRIYGTGPSGALWYGELQDISMDLTTDLKTAFAEGNYAFASADGQRTIKIDAKHYKLDAGGLAYSLGGTVAANSTGVAVDEVGTIATHAYALAKSNPLTILDVVVGVVTNGIEAPVHYQIVDSGSEVAGASCSFAVADSTGTLTFASGDSATYVRVTYTYTLGSDAGTVISVASTYQNSQPTFKLVALKRDISSLGDGSTAVQLWTFNAVRDGGIKNEWKEGDYTVFQRSFQAFADPMGNVLSVVDVNL